MLCKHEIRLVSWGMSFTMFESNESDFAIMDRNCQKARQMSRMCTMCTYHVHRGIPLCETATCRSVTRLFYGCVGRQTDFVVADNVPLQVRARVAAAEAATEARVLRAFMEGFKALFSEASGNIVSNLEVRVGHCRSAALMSF